MLRVFLVTTVASVLLENKGGAVLPARAQSFASLGFGLVWFGRGVVRRLAALFRLFKC